MERGKAETMQSSHQPQNVNSCFIKIMCSQEAAAASWSKYAQYRRQHWRSLRGQWPDVSTLALLPGNDIYCLEMHKINDHFCAAAGRSYHPISEPVCSVTSAGLGTLASGDSGDTGHCGDGADKWAPSRVPQFCHLYWIDRYNVLRKAIN